MLASDPDADVQRRAGYEPTDFAGAFTAGVRFAARALPDGPFRVVGPVEVERVGEVTVDCGRLCVFDALDRTWVDRTLVPLNREVPVGRHPVWWSHDRGRTLAGLIRFAEREVSTWTPVRFRPDAPMPIPPHLPVAPVRFSLAIGDADAVARTLPDRAVAAERVLRAIFGEPVGPAPETPTPDPVLTSLREGLNLRQAVCAAGVVAFRADAGVPAWWGLAADGALVAVGFDFEGLRIARDQVIDVPLALVQPGVTAVEDTRILGLDAHHVRIWVPATSAFRSVVFPGQLPAPVKTGGNDQGWELVVRVNRDLPAPTRLRLTFSAPSLPAARLPALGPHDLDEWLSEVIGYPAS